MYRVDDLKYTIEYMEKYMIGIVYKEQIKGLIMGCLSVGMGMEYIDRCLDIYKHCKK